MPVRAKFSRTSLSVRDLVQNALEPFDVLMELREQHLELHIGDEQFIGDGAWTTEAVGNIVKNCIEHTPVGGILTICAVENAIYTEIVIQDNGPGIDKEDLPHLFERFYKGKYSRGTECWDRSCISTYDYYRSKWNYPG